MCSKGGSDSVSEFGGEWSDGRGQWDPQVFSIFVFVYVVVFVFKNGQCGTQVSDIFA